MFKEKEDKEEELNEMRKIAGLDHKQTYNDNAYMQSIRDLAGI